MVRLAVILAALLSSCGAGELTEVPFEGTASMRYKGRVVHDGERSLAEGEWKFWYASGEMQAEGEFEGGGTPQAEHLLEDRTLIPVRGRAEWWTFWDEEGLLVAEGDHEEGLRDDLWVTWYGNGQQCCTGKFAAGLEDDYHVHWDPQGRKRDTRIYVAGKLSGTRLVFDEHGDLIWSGEYLNGELISSEPPGASEPEVHALIDCLEGAEIGMATPLDEFPPDLAAQLGQ